MAQWIKVLAIESDDLNFLPKTHKVEAENQKSSPCCPLTFTCTPWYEYKHFTHTCTITP